MDDETTTKTVKLPWGKSVATGPVKRNVIARLDGWLKPYVKAFEESAIAHLLGYIGAAFGFGALILGFVQFWGYIDDRSRELVIQEQERVQRAWETLRLPIGGEIGKGRALNAVIADGSDVNALSLSCRTAGSWDDAQKKCTNRPVYSNIDLAEPAATPTSSLKHPAKRGVPHTLAILQLAVFNDTELIHPNFRGRIISTRGVEDMRLENADFSLTRIFMVQKMSFHTGPCDLSYAELEISKSIAEPLEWLGGCNVTGLSLFYESTEEGQADQAPPTGDRNWAWADAPPVIYSAYNGTINPVSVEFLEKLIFCDPRYRKDAPQIAAPPLTGKILPAAMGVVPQIKGVRWSHDNRPSPEQKPAIEQACLQMDWKAAAMRYPDRYPPIPVH